MRLGIGASLESISQQSDKLFRELTSFFALMKDEFGDNPSSSSVMAAFGKKHNFEKIVMDHLGINVKFAPSEHRYENAYCSLPQISKNHPFLETWYREFYSSDDLIKNVEIGAKKYKELCGTIDSHKGKVSGVYSKIPFEVSITQGCIAKNDPKVCAAIMLHELGHAWYYLCLLHCTLTSNFFVTAIREARSGEEKRKVMSILSSKELLRYIEMTEEEIASKEDKLEFIIFSNVAQAAQSDIGADVYSESSCEHMADEFASKHGASEYLVQVLAKWNSPHTKKTIAALNIVDSIINLISLAMAGWAFALGLAVTMVNPILGLYGLLVVVLVGHLLVNMPSNMSLKRGGYDLPRERMDKLYGAAVQRLRSDDLNKEEKLGVIKSLERMDKIRKEFNDNYSAIGQLYSLISAKKRHTMKSIKNQRIIEDLASNELFLRSEKLINGV